MEGWLGFSLAIGGALFFSWLLLVLLFTPAVDYHVRRTIDVSSPDFLHLIQTTCNSPLYHSNQLTVFRNGNEFYPAMMDAIRAATQSVSLECYIFEDGHYGRLFVDLLCERAAAGATVMVVVDAIGAGTWKAAALGRVRDAGGRVAYYQSIKWYSLHRLNNRTHREILVVDGRVAFVGGAGIADRWGMATGSTPQWRDTMVRVEGPMVAGIQSVFAENWLECCGEILSG
jgi:cardiolipin synthase